MPIQSPRLDDLRYDRIVEELIRRIPVHTPEWTDHNDSDPGITLIQLFAHLTELTGYRLNRVPEKNHIELLKLLGVRLKPAHAARTQIAFFLAGIELLESFTLRQGARLRATVGEPPPTFETDRDIDIVPAEPMLLITTESSELWDLGRLEKREEPPDDPLDNDFMTVVWDGGKPKLKEMPLEPVTVFPKSEQNYLWLGLAFNAAINAGFRGTCVALTIQFDDDEQPRLDAVEDCREDRWAEEDAEAIDWLHYFDQKTQRMQQVPGRIYDTTDQLECSGTIRFTVPLDLGPIPDGMFCNLRDATTPSSDQGCPQLAEVLKNGLESIAESGEDTIDLGGFKTLLTNAITDIQAEAVSAEPSVPHPLPAALRQKAMGWLRLELPKALPEGWTSPQVRILTFNAVAATHATTVTNELLGKTTGRAGQQARLAHRNVLGEVELAIQEEVDGPMVTWRQVESMDAQGPHDRVFELDAEAGILYFGDGHRGRIPPLTPGGGSIVALRYRHGGGRAGELEVGTITSLQSPANGLRGAVNFVAARGGRDTETLDEAKARARKELSTRHRAVTADDFQFIAGQTPDVRVARVEVVPLRRPLSPGSCSAIPKTWRCGNGMPAESAGLQDDLTAHGAVTLVVVPDLPDPNHPEPLPTPSFLRSVCEHINKHRLVTTEVHVVPPQYMRLCRFQIVVRGEPGYTRTQLQGLVEQRLATYLHVLKGGEDGRGFPFGGQLHTADLIAQVFRTEGVNRVEYLSADFTRTKTNATPRQGRLVLCPTRPDDHASIQLGAEENVSVDLDSLLLSTKE